MPLASHGGLVSTTLPREKSGLPYSSSLAASHWRSSATSGRRRTGSALWRASPPRSCCLQGTADPARPTLVRPTDTTARLAINRTTSGKRPQPFQYQVIEDHEIPDH